MINKEFIQSRREALIKAAEAAFDSLSSTQDECEHIIEEIEELLLDKQRRYQMAAVEKEVAIQTFMACVDKEVAACKVLLDKYARSHSWAHSGCYSISLSADHSPLLIQAVYAYGTHETEGYATMVFQRLEFSGPGVYGTTKYTLPEAIRKALLAIHSLKPKA